jgi:hypothetical protein
MPPGAAPASQSFTRRRTHVNTIARVTWRGGAGIACYAADGIAAAVAGAAAVAVALHSMLA